MPAPTIAPIRHDQVDAARRVIYSVAHGMFHPEMTYAEAVAYWDERGTLSDLDDVTGNYFNQGGTFLVMVSGGQVIGTGALRRLEEQVAELKRLWLLPEYHGQGLGYRMVMELFATARRLGYRTVRLETDRLHQSRALAFYRRLGFTEIPRYGDDPEAIALELQLGR